MTIVAVAAIVAFAAMGGKVKAQSLSDNGIFYHAFSSPWSSSLNPAMFPETAKWYVSVARTNADISLPFSYNDLNLKYDPVRNATVFNVTDFLQTMADRQCRFSTNADMNLLGVGFSIGSHLHLMLDAGIRSNSTVTLPLELTRIVTEGNLNQNRHLDLGTTMLAHYMAYGHVSAGVAYEFTGLPLTLGARVNLLDGLAMASWTNWQWISLPPPTPRALISHSTTWFTLPDWPSSPSTRTTSLLSSINLLSRTTLVSPSTLV